MSKRFVAVCVDGVIETHAVGVSSDYATLCGLDGDDPHGAGQTPVDLPAGRNKIDCYHCINIIRQAKLYRASDLTE